MRGIAGCESRMQELMSRLGDGGPTTHAPALPSLGGPLTPGGASSPGAETAKTVAGMRVMGGGLLPPAATFGQSFAQTLDNKLGAPLAPLDPIAGGMKLTPAGTSTPNVDQLKAMCKEVAAKQGIDPAVFEGLVQTESDFNPKLVSKVGAMGLAQLMPKTAESLGVNDPYDPRQNLEGGAKYLAQMVKQFNGDMRLALAAYNAGPGAVQRAGGVPPFPETQDYVRKVLTRADNYRG